MRHPETLIRPTYIRQAQKIQINDMKSKNTEGTPFSFLCGFQARKQADNEAFPWKPATV